MKSLLPINFFSIPSPFHQKIENLKRFMDLGSQEKKSPKEKEISFGDFISRPSGISFSLHPPEG